MVTVSTINLAQYNFSLHVRGESKTAIDSEFHAVDSRF